MTHTNRAGVLLTLLSASLGASLACAATELTTCGQVTTGNAYLAANLDCSAAMGSAVTMDGGTLDLKGFTLKGASAGGVECSRPCRVVSDPPGGTISVTGNFGIAAVDLPVNVTDVLIDGMPSAGYGIFAGRVKAIGTTIDGFAYGVSANVFRMDGSTISNISDTGVSAAKLRARDSQFVNTTNGFVVTRATANNTQLLGGGGRGIIADTGVKLVDSVVSGFAADGIQTTADNIKIVRTEISNNGGAGVVDLFTRGNVRIEGSTISGNAKEGVVAAHGGTILVSAGSQITNNGLDGIVDGPGIVSIVHSVSDSTVTGNGTDLACGVSRTCADISTGLHPVVTNTTCAHSYNTNSGFPGTNWGICSLD